MDSLLYFSATIPIILSFPQFVSSATSGTYLLHFCDNQFNYTNNSSVFQNNLNHFLTNLSSQTPLTNFYNSTFGIDENTVYALSFCPAYIAAQDCQACVQDASHSITQYCPNQKKAIIYYVECVVRYANYSFFSKAEHDPGVSWSSSISFYNPDRLDQVLANTMDGLITKAAFGSSTTKTKTKFATGEAKINGSQQLYCFMQCTPDLTENACRDCLLYALERLQYRTHGKDWGLDYIPNCQARYDLVAFYEVVPPPSLPPSASTENTTINTTGPPALLRPSSVMSKSGQSLRILAVPPHKSNFKFSIFHHRSQKMFLVFVGKKRKTSVTFITTITLAAILVILLVIFVGNYLIMRKVNATLGGPLERPCRLLE